MGGGDDDDGLNGLEMEGSAAWQWTDWWLSSSKMGGSTMGLAARWLNGLAMNLRRLGSLADWRLGGSAAQWLGGLAVAGMNSSAAWRLSDGRLDGSATSGVRQGRGEESVVVPFCLQVLSLKLPVSCVASRSLHRVCTGFYAVTTVVPLPAS